MKLTLYPEKAKSLTDPKPGLECAEITAGNNFMRRPGCKSYELSNHPGNVMVTISDRKYAKQDGSGVEFYCPHVLSLADYYPFGMQITDRTWSSNNYRFGFNGQEKDDEVYGAGNVYTAMFWEYDPRLGRRWNLDPKPQISISDYACFGGNPIMYSDPYGDFKTRAGAWFYKMFHGGDEILKDKNSGEYFVGREVPDISEIGGATYQRRFGWEGQNSPTSLKSEVTELYNSQHDQSTSEVLYGTRQDGSFGVTGTQVIGLVKPAFDPIDFGLLVSGACLVKSSISVAAKGGFSTVDDLIAAGTKMPKIKGATQLSVKGNVDDIYNSLSKGGELIKPNQIKLPNGTLITKYPSSTTRVPTLQINQGGKLFKIRIE